MMCDINDDTPFEVKVNSDMPLITGEVCESGEDDRIFDMKNFIFRWTNRKKNKILDKQWDFSYMYNYFSYFKYEQNVRFWGFNGFDINMLEGIDSANKTLSGCIELSHCRIDFYHDQKRIDSCEDVKNANLTRVGSIFQMIENIRGAFVLNNAEYKQKICPLMFSNIGSENLFIVNNVDTFYKRNVIAFSNYTFDDLNSPITVLMLNNMHNINLDSSILHPSVFHKILIIVIPSGSLNSINGTIFRQFNLHVLIIIRISEIFISFYIMANFILLFKICHIFSLPWLCRFNCLFINISIRNLKQGMKKCCN